MRKIMLVIAALAAIAAVPAEARCLVELWPSGRCDPTNGRADPEIPPPSTTTLVEEFAGGVDRPADWRDRYRYSVPYRGDAYPPKAWKSEHHIEVK